jgi:cytochrome c biogenesis protein CcdA/thiol-disulfide isomerase/thioredoxin
MLLIALVYLGGVLTIVSPCILPVLPFVFARADRSFLRSGVPLLAGMAITFAGVASLAAVGGGWAVQANEYGRVAAMVLLGVFGLALLWPGLGDRLMQPLVGLGNALSRRASRGPGEDRGVGESLLLGVATGLLWTPCAGPVLGLVLTGAALEGVGARTTTLLLVFALGAATSLAAALLVGGGVMRAMRRSLGLGEWIRRGLGVLVLAGVAAIALGLDTGFLTRISLANTSLEQDLLNRLHPVDAQAQPSGSVAMSATTAMNGSPSMSGSMTMNGGAAMSGAMAMNGSPAMSGAMAMNGGSAMMAAQAAAHGASAVEGMLPSLDGAAQWLNSPPLTQEQLRGKVVLIDFWTYSCINCLRAIPYVRAWADKYKAQGLVVIGVHTPEFAFEKNLDNVRRAIADLKIQYPVAVDNNYAIWRAFKNNYWPAHYFVDGMGRIRGHHFGEGDYDGSERLIQSLLAESGTHVTDELVAVAAKGAEASPDLANVRSPETYVGYERAEHFVSPGGAVRDARHIYTAGEPMLNEWSLAGDWTIGSEEAALNAAKGRLVYRFHARDLHLVLGPGRDDQAVRFRITVNGAAPGNDRGTDVDREGRGVVTRQRLYQLIRQTGEIEDRTFEIEFLDPGVRVYAFTFG